MTKKCGPELGGLLWRHLTPQKKSNIGAQLQSITCIKAPKTFWKIYFLYDFFGAHKLVLTIPYHSGQAFYHLVLRPPAGPMCINLFIPSRFLTTYMKFVNCCLRYIATCGKFFI